MKAAAVRGLDGGGGATGKTVERPPGWLSWLKSNSLWILAVISALGGAYKFIAEPIQALQIHSATVTEQLANQNAKLEDLSRDVADVDSDLHADFNELTKSIHGVDVRLTAVETRLGEVGDRLSEVSAEVRVLGKRLHEHDHQRAMNPALGATSWSEEEFVRP